MYITQEVSPMTQMWRFHICALDSDCNILSRIWRAHLNTPRFHLAVAFRPDDRFIERLGERPSWFIFVRYIVVE